jgi:anti-sigma factor RsiW
MKLIAHPLVCQEAVELMSDYVEGTLSRRDRRRLEKHLASCPHCSMYLEQIRATIAASGVVYPEDIDPKALDELTDIFRKFHDQADDA